MNARKFQIFTDEYRKQLTAAHEKYPDEYCFPRSELDAVIARMIPAIERGSFNKEGHAFRATCKALNIKHTYKAINAFLER